MKKVLVNIEESCVKNRICVRWAGGYDRDLVTKIRNVPGRNYVKTNGRHWHVPLDLETCRLMREVFGESLVIGDELRSWATGAVREEGKLHSIAEKSTATLERLPSVLPSLYEAIHLGPLGRYMDAQRRSEALLEPASYQAADVEFLAQARAPLNGNEQGTGKTIEWIATIWEAGLEEGDHLVICPKAAADGTWAGELERWQAEVLEQVGIFMCVEDDREDREAVIRRWLECDLPTRWVVINPHMIMYRKDPERLSPLTLAVSGKRAEETACYCSERKGAHEHYLRPYPELTERKWRTVVIDEAHRGVARNHKSLTYRSLKDIELTDDGKMCLMSGTPMKKFGGADIWGMLHFLNPDQFSSYWRFVDSFFEITDNGFGKKVGRLRPEREEAMFRTLTPYVLRRTKAEVAPWLPPKLYVDVNVRMSKRQETQYRRMLEEAISQLGTKEITAGGILDKIVRLKQFANGHCKVDPETGEIIPIASEKVEAMIEKMREVGMFDEGSTRKQLVFSQSRRMVEYIAKRLEKEGLGIATITGSTKDRRELVRRFQEEDDIRVMVIVTTAGGVSLTLDRADEVHLIDEMWSPDDDAQAEDRAHRVSRIHQVTVFIYRSIGTIDEDIALSKAEKADSHERILDVRRRILSSRT